MPRCSSRPRLPDDEPGDGQCREARDRRAGRGSGRSAARTRSRPCGRRSRGERSQSVAPGDLLEVRAQAVVAAAEAELVGASCAAGRPSRSSRPRSTATRTWPPPPIQPASRPIQPGALPPVAGPDEDRDDLGHLARAAFDREVVDVAAAAAVLVEQLVVEDVQSEVELAAAQFWPAFVRIISGIAVSAIDHDHDEVDEAERRSRAGRCAYRPCRRGRSRRAGSGGR